MRSSFSLTAEALRAWGHTATAVVRDVDNGDVSQRWQQSHTADDYVRQSFGSDVCLLNLRRSHTLQTKLSCICSGCAVECPSPSASADTGCIIRLVQLR